MAKHNIDHTHIDLHQCCLKIKELWQDRLEQINLKIPQWIKHGLQQKYM